MPCNKSYGRVFALGGALLGLLVLPSSLAAGQSSRSLSSLEKNAAAVKAQDEKYQRLERAARRAISGMCDDCRRRAARRTRPTDPSPIYDPHTGVLEPPPSR